MAREAVTEQTLLRELNLMLFTHDGCIDCHFTFVVKPKEAPGAGANWDYANLACSGEPAEDCREAASYVMKAAKEKYDLA